MPRKYTTTDERCPTELRDLIDSVNLLPKDLKQLEEELTKLGSRSWKENNDELSIEMRQLLSPECAAQLNKILNGLRMKTFLNELQQLRKLINEKLTLNTVINGFQMFIWNNNPSQTFGFDKSITTFGFNQDSTIQLFSVIEILTRNKVPIKRLRVCPICEDIFWAKKTNSQTCGEMKCVETLGNRKRLAKAKAEKEAKAKADEEKQRKRQEWLNQDFSQKERQKKNGTI